MQRPRHIAIAGGGIVGLACALELRLRGFQVTVFDSGAAAREASWAAGGMLAAEDPENPSNLSGFSLYSRASYRDFLKRIHELSGRTVQLRTRETVQVLDTGHHGTAGIRLSPKEAVSLVSGLSYTAPGYLLLQEDSVDPRELCGALQLAVGNAGIALREHERVLSCQPTEKGVLLMSARGSFPADVFVNCCGAWADSLLPTVAVGPSKGQMLVIVQPNENRLTRVLRSSEVYLIPRGDDRIVVGATVEDAGYSKQVEPEALAQIRKRAAALWEPAANAPQVDSWAGLRPGTADGLPVIGCYDSEGRQFVASGHFRNGILLAPGTARIVADLIGDIAPAIDLAPFAPLRPSISAVCDKHFAAAL